MSSGNVIIGSVVLSVVSLLGYSIYSADEPNNATTPNAQSYTDIPTTIRLKPVRTLGGATPTPIAPGFAYTPGASAAPSNTTFACNGFLSVNDPVAWEWQTQQVNIETGKRGFGQSGADYAFLDLKGGKVGGGFLQAPGFCDVTVGYISDKPLETKTANEEDIVVPSKLFKGSIPSEQRAVLFDGALEAWTSSDRQKAGYCQLYVRFNKQANASVDFNNVRHKETSVFFLSQDGRNVYKFDMRNSTGQPYFGACPIEITQIKLPRVPDEPAKIFVDAQTPISSEVSGYQTAQNLQIVFNETSRIELREQNIPVSVTPGTKYSVERTVSSSNEVSFGQTDTTGLDVGSPMIALLTGGLLSAEVKNTWENRFTKTMAQSSSITARVELDPAYCTEWTYNVYATVRDGTLTAPDYGLKRPLQFTVTENIFIQAKPLCPANSNQGIKPVEISLAPAHQLKPKFG